MKLTLSVEGFDDNKEKYLEDQGKSTKEAYEMYDKEVGLENLRDIVDSLHECESKSEILHLIKKDPTVNDLLSGLTETECVEKLSNIVVSVEGRRSNVSSVYGYAYVPEDSLNTILKVGLKSVVQLYKETGDPAYLEKYRSRTAEHFDIPEKDVTPDQIIEYLTETRKEMGPEGADAVYLLPGIIPEGVSEELDRFRQRPVVKAELNPYEDRLYAVETQKAGYMEVKIGLEDVVDLQDEFRKAWTSKEYHDRAAPEMLFSKIPHLVVVGGIKPEHLSKVE